MTLKIHSGSCHCGAVRFEAEIDIAQGTVKCNCSSCVKARSWLTIVPASRYRLTSGAESKRTINGRHRGNPSRRSNFISAKYAAFARLGGAKWKPWAALSTPFRFPCSTRLILRNWRRGRSNMSTAFTIALIENRLINVSSEHRRVSRTCGSISNFSSPRGTATNRRKPR